MSAQLEPRLFNVTEYYKMAKAGILKPDDRVELIEGEIIRRTRFGLMTFPSQSRILRCSRRAWITMLLDTRLPKMRCW